MYTIRIRFTKNRAVSHGFLFDFIFKFILDFNPKGNVYYNHEKDI